MKQTIKLSPKPFIKKIRSVSLIGSCLALLALSTGCGTLWVTGHVAHEKIQDPFTQTDVNRAVAAQDWEQLERYCVTTGTTTNSLARTSACRAVTDAYVEQKAWVRLKTICQQDAWGKYRKWYTRHYTCEKLAQAGS